MHSTLFADSALDLPSLGKLVLSSLIFAVVGIVVFGAAFWVITKIAPFSIRKEIEEDQNTSLGIVIGAVIIGLSLIISAAIKG
jgi:putative membrane protein